MAGALQGYEHIEVCSRCATRYLERLPKSRGKVVYVCERCLAMDDIRDEVADLVGKLFRAVGADGPLRGSLRAGSKNKGKESR